MSNTTQEGSGKNGGTVPVTVKRENTALRTILEGDASMVRAEEVGDIIASPDGAAAQAMNETHTYTCEERKAIATKVTMKNLDRMVQQRLVKAGLLDPPAATKGKK